MAISEKFIIGILNKVTIEKLDKKSGIYIKWYNPFLNNSIGIKLELDKIFKIELISYIGLTANFSIQFYKSEYEFSRIVSYRDRISDLLFFFELENYIKVNYPSLSIEFDIEDLLIENIFPDIF